MLLLVERRVFLLCLQPDPAVSSSRICLGIPLSCLAFCSPTVSWAGHTGRLFPGVEGLLRMRTPFPLLQGQHRDLRAEHFICARSCYIRIQFNCVVIHLLHLHIIMQYSSKIHWHNHEIHPPMYKILLQADVITK